MLLRSIDTRLGTRLSIRMSADSGGPLAHLSVRLQPPYALPQAQPAASDFGTRSHAKTWRRLTRLVDSVADVDGSGYGWRNWGEVVGIRWDSDDPSIRFSHAHLALQAAVEGVGIAMARRVLAADDLASGRLLRIAPTCPSVAARFAYYFVTRDEPDARGRTLISWLKAELAALETA